MSSSFKLSDSSALILRWIRNEFYETAAARDYLTQLDLSAGDELYKACQKIWPHYDEVIKNRKYGIRRLCAEHIQPQIILAGAGLDAMGLELATLHPQSRIYDLDHAHMPEKQRLVKCDNLFCIQADLTNPEQTMTALTQTGWQANRLSLLVFEGISYYLTAEALAALTSAIAPACVIAEFLLPAAVMNKKAAAIADEVFGTVMDMCDIKTLTRYTADNLAALLDRRVIDVWQMARLEQERNGYQHYFISPDFRWIELAILK